MSSSNRPRSEPPTAPAAGPADPKSPAPVRPRLPLRTKLLFSVLTAVLVLAVLENASRLVLTVAPNPRWDYDRQLLQALGFPALADLLQADDTRFWALRPNLDGLLLTGQFADSPVIRFRVSTDAAGLRRVPPVGPSQQRVLFLGDSCTFGVGVEDHETLPARVQERLRDVSCTNAGVPGYTAFQGLRLLEELLPQILPHVVVINFGRNDSLVWDGRSDLEHAAQLERQRARWWNRLRCVHLAARLLRTAPPPQPPQGGAPRLSDAEFEATVRDMIAACRAHGAWPVLLIWPERLQMTEERTHSKQRVLLRLAEAERLPCLDLTPHLRGGGGAALYLDVVHANAAGCELAAEPVEATVRLLLLRMKATSPPPGRK